MKLPNIIFEIANAHAGNELALVQLVEQFKRIDYQPKAIKFQIFSPDGIALPDFSWYQTYKELFLSPEVWKRVIASAIEGGEVWLDLFDGYGVEALQANLSHISGVKLQASVLDNFDIMQSLAATDLSRVRLMLNIAGHDLSRVHSYVAEYGKLGARELILQVGFQSYPTPIEQTGLQKIAVLRAAFPNLAICMADHLPGGEPFARRVPALAAALGCDFIEKHFCLKRSETKYDHYSALEEPEVNEMLTEIRNTASASDGAFVSEPEADYLRNSYQAPIAKHAVSAGSLMAGSDLQFRRTSRTGLTFPDLQARQKAFSILSKDIPEHAVIEAADYRSASIGVIVACRMKSSRLKNKALLPIAGVPSVERCLNNCRNIRSASQVVLATSNLPEDAVLEKHVMDGAVKLWRGDPDDVIQRYLGACDTYGIDVVVRVTADCPVVSAEIAEYLIQRHFAAGVDYTAARECAIGSNAEIYNTEALRRVIRLMGSANHSEYMTWYLRNNPDIFKVNLVDLPASMVRDYRLTLDYPEDLEMFEQLFRRLEERGEAPTLANVFKVLDAEPDVARINHHLTVAYRADPELIEKLNRVTRIHRPAMT